MHRSKLVSKGRRGNEPGVTKPAGVYAGSDAGTPEQPLRVGAWHRRSCGGRGRNGSRGGCVCSSTGRGHRDGRGQVGVWRPHSRLPLRKAGLGGQRSWRPAEVPRLGAPPPALGTSVLGLAECRAGEARERRRRGEGGHRRPRGPWSASPRGRAAAPLRASRVGRRGTIARALCSAGGPARCGAAGKACAWVTARAGAAVNRVRDPNRPVSDGSDRESARSNGYQVNGWRGPIHEPVFGSRIEYRLDRSTLGPPP